MKLIALVRCGSIVLTLLHARVLIADTYTWDANGTANLQTNGPGQWFGSNLWWNGSNTTWDNSGTTIAQMGTTGSSVVAGNTVTISTNTANAGGMNFMGFAASPTTAGTQYTIAGATGGTLNFAPNSVITAADLSSTSGNFITFANSLVVTGNGLTVQKSGGTTMQFMRFDMASNPNLIGTLTIKGNDGGIFFRSGAAGTFGAMSNVVVEANSSFSINGGGIYTQAMSLAGYGGANQYGAMRIDGSNTTLTGAITLTADAGIQTNTGGVTNVLIKGGISGSGGLTRFATGAGTGTLIISSTNTYTGATTLGRAGTFAGAITILDFNAELTPESDILYNLQTAGDLNFVGGSNSSTVLTLNGKAGGNNSQRFGNVSTTGASTTVGGLGIVNLVTTDGGSISLSVGNITRTALGMISFRSASAGSISTTMEDGFLGTWATYRDAAGNTTWAQVSNFALTTFTGDLAHVTDTAISALTGHAAEKHLTISSKSTGTVTASGSITDIATASMTDAGFDRTLALGGNTLRLGPVGGVQLATMAQDLTIAGGTLTAGGTVSGTPGQIMLTNNSTTSALHIDAVISNNGAGGTVTLLVNGVTGSKVILGGNNNYTGITTIAAGVVEVRHNSALGSSGTLTVMDGAALQLPGGITLSRTMSVGGTGTANDGVIRNLGGNNTISGLITTTGPVRIQSDAGTLTFSTGTAAGNIFNSSSSANTMVFGGAGEIVVSSRINTSSQALSKDGTGRLTLSGDNAFTGAFTASAGTLRISHVNALGTTAGTTAVSSGATLELVFATDSTIAEPLTLDGTGTGGFGSGAVRNVEGNNTLSGILAVGSTASGSIVADGGTILTLSGTLRNGNTSATTNTRTMVLGGSGTINLTGTVTNGSTPATNLTALAKADAGTLNIRAATSHTGATIMRGGVLNLDFINAAPAANLILSSNAASFNGGTLRLSGKDGITNHQSFATTSMIAGRSSIVASSGIGGTVRLALGAITRAGSSGSVLDITLPSMGGIATTTLNTGGIINGGMTVGKDTWATSAASSTSGVSWVDASDSITVGGLTNGSQVSFTGTAPGGLTAGTVYYVVNATAGSFQVSATDGGTAIALTNGGSTGTLIQGGAITGLGAAGYSSGFVTGANVDVPEGETTQPSITINSLRFNAVNGSTVNISSSSLINTTGGILITSAVAGDVMIQSSASTIRNMSMPAAVSDLTVHHHGTGLFTIGSTINLVNTGAITKTGTGTMTLAGTVETNAVQLRVYEGVFNIVGGNRFTGTDPALTIGSATTSAKISFGNGASSGGETFTSISVAGVGSSLVGSGTVTYAVGLANTGTTDLRQLMLGGSGTNENNISYEIYAGGTTLLGATNTYAGRTNIGHGTVEVTKLSLSGVASSLGTGSASPAIVMGNTTSNTATVATLRYVGTENAVTDRSLRLHTDDTPMISIAAVVENNGTGSLQFTSAFTVTGTSTLGRTLRLTGTNTGENKIVSITDGTPSVVSLEKAGTGTWILTGNSTYTGGTTVSNGILQLGDGGTAGMVGGGSISVSAGATLMVSRSNAAAMSNVIAGAGALAVNNTASGVLTLSGTGNTYTGGTTVNSGTLAFTNASGSATGEGAVRVAIGATLAGTGRIDATNGNSIHVNGNLSVGLSTTAAGTMTLTTAGAGSLEIHQQGALVMDLVSGAGSGMLNGTGTAADLLVVGGAMSLLPGSTLRVQGNALSGWAEGDAWRLIDWSTLGGSAGGTTFSTVELPMLSGSLVWDLSGLYTTGVIAIAVPEPGRGVLMMVGLMGVWARRKRSGSGRQAGSRKDCH